MASPSARRRLDKSFGAQAGPQPVAGPMADPRRAGGSGWLGGDPARPAGDPTASIELLEPLRYVSRGGLKLEHALDTFGLDPAGLIVADVGASTGGFTDCLLQRDAARVYAIDVGYGQLAENCGVTHG